MSVQELPPPGQSRTLLLPGAAGDIETLVALPDTAPRDFALICHPHPLHGGALGNKVVYALAASALKAGFAVARFNFRGVGKSQGAHDHGNGETEDTLAVAAFLRERLPGARLLLCGFSFGAFVSLKAAQRAQPAALISIAPPFKYFSGEPLPPRPDAPWLVVHSRDDDIVDYTETREAVMKYQPPPELATMDGAGHFFHGKLNELQETVADFIRRTWFDVT